ncbi:MAG: sugar ABC transporter substrate-binding protein [Christensenellales bacterium]
MKRFVLTSLILLAVITFCACGSIAMEKESLTVTPAQTEFNDSKAISPPEIGFSLAGRGGYYDQLITDIENECSSMNYRAQILTALSADQQEENIRSFLSDGVAAIVLEPFDVDALETVLTECEAQDVPVINIIDSVNGIVNMLISPDYNGIGEKAGKIAVSRLGEEGGECMMLKTEYDSFIMQLITDGFDSAIAKKENISIVYDQFCGNDEETAYTLTKAELSSKEGINFIFAQSEALGRGAARAVEEAGKDVYLVIYGGDMDIIALVQSGKADAAIFSGPGALAHDAVYYIDKIVKDDSYIPPQFAELNIQVADSKNASEYYTKDASHAEVK